MNKKLHFLSGTQVNKTIDDWYDVESLHESTMELLHKNRNTIPWFRNKEDANKLTIEVPAVLLASLIQVTQRVRNKHLVEDFLSWCEKEKTGS